MLLCADIISIYFSQDKLCVQYFFSLIAYDINADIFGDTSTSLQHDHTQRHVQGHQHSY